MGVGVSSVRRVRGDAAALLGDTVPARQHYEQALQDCAAIRHRPETALVHLGLTELDIAEGQSDSAREHLAFCIPELEDMKMRPALERALALRARL
jgi:hypothetical protein